MHSLKFQVTESCLVELQRNKKRQKETEEWEFEMNMGYHICMKFYSTSELFVMHYQATTVFTSTAVTMYIALLWQLL